MSEEMSTAALLTANAELRAALDVAMQESDRWRALAQLAQVDVGWWHATVANYVTSATVEDRAMLRGVLAEALIGLHPGASLLAELEAARAVVARARDSYDVHEYPAEKGDLYKAIAAYDEVVKARET